MIFSFVEKSSQTLNFELPLTDIFSFSPIAHAVFVPEKHWFLAVIASLKMKKNILLLEEPLLFPPPILLTQRWQIGEHFIWLAPRSLSVLLEASHTIPFSYESLKSQLNTSK